MAIDDTLSEQRCTIAIEELMTTRGQLVKNLHMAPFPVDFGAAEVGAGQRTNKDHLAHRNARCAPILPKYVRLLMLRSASRRRTGSVSSW